MPTLAAVRALTLIILLIIGAEVDGELTTLSSCICPGHEVTFECVVTGDGATIWSGTAFDHCSNRRITLLHSRFNQFEYSIHQSCGESGPIISHAVSAVNGSFTSQLIVNVSQSVIGASVECTSDSGSHIGIKQILLTTAPLPPPSNVTLSLINSSHLTFTWNSVSPNCRALHYKINVTNGGQCPNATICGVTCPTSTDTNSVSCGIKMLATLPETCAIIILPVVCGNVSGTPNGTLLIKDEISVQYYNLISTLSKWSLFPNTNTEYKKKFQQSTGLNIILPSCLLLTAVILIGVVIVIMIIILCCRHRKNQALAPNIKMTVNNSRAVNDIPKLQQSQVIYMDVGPSIEHRRPWIKPDDDKVEYATINHQHVPKDNQPKRDLSTVDKQLDLDNFLIQLCTQLTLIQKWYQFGLALGVDKDILNKYSECLPEESIVEVADYWLRNSYTKPTWRDVARALKKIGFDLLAEDNYTKCV